MQGTRVTALMALIPLLWIVGCREQPQPAPAPVVAPATSPVQYLNVTTDPANLDAAGNARYEIHSDLSEPNATITWTDTNEAFTIQFNPSKNPCSDDSNGTNKYTSTPTSKGTYIVTCHIQPNLKKDHFEYNIGPVPPNTVPKKPQPARSPSPTKTSHCEGCVIDN
ncbi:MAG: hypothetical protein WBY53_00735 [Acidobacteriaceae bacterium]